MPVFVTKKVFGGKRVYLTAAAVVFPEQYVRPTAAVCTDIGQDGDSDEGEPRWSFDDQQDIQLRFQPDPTKLSEGEWCWPVTSLPVTPEMMKAVRDETQCSMQAAKRARGSGSRGWREVAKKMTWTALGFTRRSVC